MLPNVLLRLEMASRQNLLFPNFSIYINHFPELQKPCIFWYYQWIMSIFNRKPYGDKNYSKNSMLRL